MSIYPAGSDVFSMVSFIGDDGWCRPCGCASKFENGQPSNLEFQITNVVKGAKRDVGECPDCGATWDDE